ncbi:MAG: hypothetical protein GXP09_00120 [Gammaproteobacteria bacterium]|nr:hypothetical protein [Gammaproteobacteria bacterium]
MSGICGQVNFDGTPVDPQLLRKMTQAAIHRGPDGVHYSIQNHVGLAHLSVHTTPESVTEQQPIWSKNKKYCITADARIDNREELIKPLLTDGALSNPTPGDAELILASYQKWGTACPEKLVGDFAFAIWDIKKQQIFAARDRLGCRSFHYHHSDQKFSWATEPSQLLAKPNCPLQLNHHLILQDLALPGVGGRCDSYFDGIFKLAPGERLVVNRSGINKEVYWDFDPDKEIHYSDDRDYIDHFRELFTQAVKVRLRTYGSVALFMSSGLDSTPIAATAAQLHSATPGEIPKLQILHWTYGRTPNANEFLLAREVAAQTGLSYHEQNVDDFWPLYDYPQQFPLASEPFCSPAYGFYKGTINTLSKSQRPKVCMTGFSGDFLIGGPNPYYMQQFIKRGQIAKLARKIRSQAHLTGLPHRMGWYDYFIQPLYVQPLRAQLARLLGGYRQRLPKYINPDLAQCVNLWAWKQANTEHRIINLFGSAPQWTDPARNTRYRSITRHQNVRFRAWQDNCMAHLGAENWEPWDDIRLAEFVLAIPPEQLCRGLNQKLIIRQAMINHLPRKVLENRGLRTGGPDVRADMRQASAVVVNKLLLKPVSEQMGFITGSVLRQHFKEFVADNSHWGMNLWGALCLEAWLRKFIDRPA